MQYSMNVVMDTSKTLTVNAKLNLEIVIRVPYLNMDEKCKLFFCIITNYDF